MLNNCRKILIDCDGVLTDGRLTIDHLGEKLFKQFHSRDVRSIRELVFMGFEVSIVTADEWSGIFHFAKKVGAEVLISRDKIFQLKDYIAVGDDAWDKKMLENARLKFCPADADSIIKKIPGIVVLNCLGGQGVIAELVPLLCFLDLETFII